MKKIISLLLTFTLLFTMSVSSFAASPTNNRIADEHTTAYVYVTDDKGELQKVWVETSLYRANRTRSSDGQESGSYQEGDQIEVSVRISNAQLGLGGFVGEKLSSAAKASLGRLAGNAIASQIGSTIAGGTAVVGLIANAVSLINAAWGNSGFEVTATFEWTHFQHQIQGIDLWDWGLVGVDIDTY